jgi:ABC-2 type transport system ATP-binding protein
VSPRRHDRNDILAIALRDVRLQQGGFELHIPEWTVPAGQVVGLVGPNGAGKTNLLDLVAGLRAPTSGSVRVLGGDPVAEAGRIRQRLGYMCDDLPLYDLKLRDLLKLLSGYYPTWDATLVATLVGRFELDLEQRPSALSKGQGARFRTLLAVAHRPALVVLDEPATGLDLSGRRALLTTLLEVVADAGRTVVVSSHQLADLERIADTLVVLNRGRIQTHGPADVVVPDGRTLEEVLLAGGAA